jgi:hypothetical protein
MEAPGAAGIQKLIDFVAGWAPALADPLTKSTYG